MDSGCFNAGLQALHAPAPTSRTAPWCLQSQLSSTRCREPCQKRKAAPWGRGSGLGAKALANKSALTYMGSQMGSPAAAAACEAAAMPSARPEACAEEWMHGMNTHPQFGRLLCCMCAVKHVMGIKLMVIPWSMIHAHGVTSAYCAPYT